MIVYIFNNRFFNKCVLPNKISGVYPLYTNDKNFIANIEEQNGVWNISLGKNITFISNNTTVIKEHTQYILKDVTTEEIFYVHVLPIYDNNTIRVASQVEKISIGGKPQNDIYYNMNNLPEMDVTLQYVNGAWNLDAQAENVFVCDKRVRNKRLFNGDYIFYYGLKIIVIDKLFIISNPNGQVSVNQNSFTRYSFPEETIDTSLEESIREDTPLYSKNDYFFKAPRFDAILEEAEIRIDEPPAPVAKNDTPVILTVGPQLTMMSVSMMTLATTITSYMNGDTTKTRFITSLVTVGAMLASSLLWPTITRVYNNYRIKKNEKKRQEKYHEYLQKKKAEIEVIQNKQKQVLTETLTTMETCKVVIDSKARTLWQRTVDNSDFLELRLGVGNVPAKIRINVPEERFSVEETDKMFTELQEIVNQSLIIPDVPLGINLVKNNISAVIGEESLTTQFMENLFLQIMTYHPYTELKIVVFTNDKSKWEFLKVLPHCWDNQKNIRYFATTSEEMSLISSEIEKVFDERVVNSENVQLEDDGSEKSKEDAYKNYRPYYLIFTDDITNVRNIGITRKVLKYKKNLGFSLLMVNDRLATLPSETTNFINIAEPLSGLITNELETNNQNQFVADLNKTIDIYDCASKLANIPISVEKAKYELPSSLSFLEMYEVGRVEQLNSSERWQNNNPVNSLSVPIGIDQNGELFKMDIHEKAFGPHGLVAGTTGSGKSEWIVTYILSLAVNFHPDEVQFVLIDYKGGGLAMSFENSELGIKLPHLAGTITNLDKSEINRSIASIESELKRRQSIFNEAREKLKEGSMNIYKYQQFYRKAMVDIPLSHLLIICDEFAELKQQQPEFMEQLISTSRIGRSLGVHLILATQKPSGVVNDQIWSNSKFKVALKVQDKGDSNEILKKPDAAFLKQTGSFYLSVGNDDYFNLGQSAWAGAKYYPSDVVRKKTDQSIQHIDNIGRTINYYDTVVENTNVQSQGEELLNIVQYIDEIAKKDIVFGNQLWLPNIKPELYISDLIKRYNHTPEKMNFNTPIGEYDEPRRQEQGLLKIDLAGGNIGIIGQTGSGKENLISMIIWQSILEHTPQEINYYILDFGAETLKKFAKFPHVGEVVFQDDMSKVAGVLDLVIEELDMRKNLLSDYNGSFEFYNKTSGKQLPLIVCVINAFDIFQEALPKVVDIINNMFRDAPRYGIVFVVSVSSSTGLRSRQLQYFNHTIVMQMQDESSYRSITNCRRGLIPGRYMGRGICKIGVDDDSYCEFQTALIAPQEQEFAHIKAVADQLVGYYGNIKAKQLATIPDNVTSDDLIKNITDLSMLPIGYNFYEKNIATYNLLKEKIHLFTSKELKKNVHFLYALASLLSKVPNVKVRVVDMLDIFKKPILDIKLFNSDFDPVFGALESDVLNRTETQDMGVNIIIGAGQYKKKLKKGGVEVFENMMKNIPASKQNVFILIDDYEKIRTLKLESWYNAVNTTSGLWLGQGLSSQSLITCNEVSSEDKKYNYEGLAYIIDEGEYTVIKTMMDGDD